jgi:hypothetical protein
MSLPVTAERAAIVPGLLSLLLAAQVTAEPFDVRPAPPLPTEAARWVGDPVSWESLRGKVTLVFVWTFG